MNFINHFKKVFLENEINVDYISLKILQRRKTHYHRIVMLVNYFTVYSLKYYLIYNRLYRHTPNQLHKYLIKKKEVKTFSLRT